MTTHLNDRRATEVPRNLKSIYDTCGDDYYDD